MQLREQYSKFQELGVQLVAVGMGNPSQSVAFRRGRQLPFPLLSDTTQSVYAAYGLIRFNSTDELQNGVIGGVVAQALRGNFGGMPIGDFFQLGGTFLIDTRGIARYVHRDKYTQDYAPVKDLLVVAKQIQDDMDIATSYILP